MWSLTKRLLHWFGKVRCGKAPWFRGETYWPYQDGSEEGRAQVNTQIVIAEVESDRPLTYKSDNVRPTNTSTSIHGRRLPYEGATIEEVCDPSYFDEGPHPKDTQSARAFQ